VCGRKDRLDVLVSIRDVEVRALSLAVFNLAALENRDDEAAMKIWMGGMTRPPESMSSLEMLRVYNDGRQNGE
jgi:hypothetical protein